MNKFGASSTTDDVLTGVDLKDKRILITGVSAGLGVETARALVAHGAHVVGTARDSVKAVLATAAVKLPPALMAAASSSQAAVSDDAEKPDGVRSYALDPARARALWTMSEQLVGESF